MIFLFELLLFFFFFLLSLIWHLSFQSSNAMNYCQWYECFWWSAFYNDEMLRAGARVFAFPLLFLSFPFLSYFNVDALLKYKNIWNLNYRMIQRLKGIRFKELLIRLWQMLSWIIEEPYNRKERRKKNSFRAIPMCLWSRVNLFLTKMQQNRTNTITSHSSHFIDRSVCTVHTYTWTVR